MSDYGRLPFTGAGITLGAVVIDQGQLVALAFGLVLLGAFLVRRGFRRGKGVGD